MGRPETEAVAYTPLLRLGSKGDAVKYLQSLLAGRGSDPGPIDGDFGAGTRRATVIEEDLEVTVSIRYDWIQRANA